MNEITLTQDTRIHQNGYRVHMDGTVFIVNTEEWETVCDEAKSAVRRIKVTGGYLYQVQTGEKWKDFNKGTTTPTYTTTTFVPSIWQER